MTHHDHAALLELGVILPVRVFEKDLKEINGYVRKHPTRWATRSEFVRASIQYHIRHLKMNGLYPARGKGDRKCRTSHTSK